MQLIILSSFEKGFKLFACIFIVAIYFINDINVLKIELNIFNIN